MFTQKCKQYFLIYNLQDNQRIIYAIYKHLEQKYGDKYNDFFKIYLSSLELEQRIEFIKLFTINLFSISQGDVYQFVNDCNKYFLNENNIGDNIRIAQIILVI